MVFLVLFFHYKILVEKITWPVFNFKSDSFLLKYRAFCVFLAIFFQLFFVCVTCLCILRVFNKTQSSEIVFFLLFLMALVFNSTRIFIPIMDLKDSFSNASLFISNIVLFSKILAPLSLLGITTLTSDDQRQNLEQNCFIIFISSLLLATFIPKNTGILLPDYSISTAFNKILSTMIFLITLFNALYMFYKNYEAENRQYTTIGFLILSIGYVVTFGVTNFLSLFFGILLMSTGTFMYIAELHYQYLWNN